MRILTPMLAVWTGFVGLSQAASVTTPSNTPVTAPGATAMTGQTVGTQPKTAYEWLKENTVLSYTGQFFGPDLSALGETADVNDSRLAAVPAGGTQPSTVGADGLWLSNRINAGWRINPTSSLVIQQRFYTAFLPNFTTDLKDTRLNYLNTSVLDGSVAKVGLAVNLELPTTGASIADKRLVAPALTMSSDFKVGTGWELGTILQARYYVRLREPNYGAALPKTKEEMGDRNTNDWAFVAAATTAYNINDVIAPGLYAELDMDHKYGFSGFNIEDLDLQAQIAFNLGPVTLQPYMSFRPLHFANAEEFQKSTYFGMNISAKLF